MIYHGNGAHCFANSFYMGLRSSGQTDIPEVPFLEFLTTMPFGAFYVRPAHLFFPSGPGIEPDAGINLALQTMGWTCENYHGGSEAEALAQLRTALSSGPVMVGPVDMGYLTYAPGHEHQGGLDHYIIVLEADETQVRVNDPAGWPWARLPISDFMTAWRAEAVDYGQRPYRMRWNFRREQPVSRAEMIARTLVAVRQRLAAEWSHPDLAQGADAICTLAHDLRETVPDPIAGRLIWFALPLAADRLNNAAAYLREGDAIPAADIALAAARLYGETLTAAIQHDWTTAAALLERIAPLEHDLEQALRAG
ncbi:MAG TPA: hypothetical protein VHO69_19850 [Phototrophicaceae bacterium]|nr:hypothetical protein [Phototrophicaceae bacterium]